MRNKIFCILVLLSMGTLSTSEVSAQESGGWQVEKDEDNSDTQFYREQKTHFLNPDNKGKSVSSLTIYPTTVNGWSDVESGNGWVVLSTSVSGIKQKTWTYSYNGPGTGTVQATSKAKLTGKVTLGGATASTGYRGEIEVSSQGGPDISGTASLEQADSTKDQSGGALTIVIAKVNFNSTVNAPSGVEVKDGWPLKGGKREETNWYQYSSQTRATLASAGKRKFSFIGMWGASAYARSDLNGEVDINLLLGATIGKDKNPGNLCKEVSCEGTSNRDSSGSYGVYGSSGSKVDSKRSGEEKVFLVNDPKVVGTTYTPNRYDPTNGSTSTGTTSPSNSKTSDPYVSTRKIIARPKVSMPIRYVSSNVGRLKRTTSSSGAYDSSGSAVYPEAGKVLFPPMRVDDEKRVYNANSLHTRIGLQLRTYIKNAGGIGPVFRQADRDGSGKLNKKEVAQFLKKQAKIDLPFYITYSLAAGKLIESIEDHFHGSDKRKKDGYLSQEEIAEYL